MEAAEKEPGAWPLPPQADLLQELHVDSWALAGKTDDKGRLWPNPYAVSWIVDKEVLSMQSH